MSMRLKKEVAASMRAQFLDAINMKSFEEAESKLYISQRTLREYALLGVHGVMPIVRMAESIGGSVDVQWALRPLKRKVTLAPFLRKGRSRSPKPSPKPSTRKRRARS